MHLNCTQIYTSHVTENTVVHYKDKQVNALGELIDACSEIHKK